jgi:hypothetical protein
MLSGGPGWQRWVKRSAGCGGKGREWEREMGKREMGKREMGGGRRRLDRNGRRGGKKLLGLGD